MTSSTIKEIAPCFAAALGFVVFGLGAPFAVIMTTVVIAIATMVYCWTIPAFRRASPPGYGKSDLFKDIAKGATLSFLIVAAAVVALLYVANGF